MFHSFLYVYQRVDVNCDFRSTGTQGLPNKWGHRMDIFKPYTALEANIWICFATDDRIKMVAIWGLNQKDLWKYDENQLGPSSMEHPKSKPKDVDSQIAREVDERRTSVQHLSEQCSNLSFHEVLFGWESHFMRIIPNI